MANIVQGIDINVGIHGQDKIRRTASDIKDLQKAVDSVQGGTKPATDIKSATTMKNQLNFLKQMEQIQTKMMRDMKSGEFIGTKEYVKGLDNSIKRMKQMKDIVEDIGDESDEQDKKRKRIQAESGITGMAQRLGGGISGVGGALGSGNIVGAGISAIGQAGRTAKGVGEDIGGGTGMTIAKAGIWGLVASAVLAGGAGINQLIYGEFEKIAPQLYGYEIAGGTNITDRTQDKYGVWHKSAYQNIREASEQNLLDRTQVMQGIDIARGTSGLRSTGTANDIIAMMKTGVSAEQAGAIMGMETRYGGGMTGTGFVELAKRGGYGRRTEDFAGAVSQLTRGLQDMGVDIGAEAGAQIVSDMGAKYGEIFRGGAGVQVAGGMNQAIRGAMALESPEQAMMYRALYRGNFRETMLAMEKGIANPENMARIVEYAKSVAPDDEEAQARILGKMGVSGYSQRLAMLGVKVPKSEAELKEERTTRGGVGVSEAGKTVQATLPLEIKSETGYVTIVRGFIRGMIANEAGGGGVNNVMTPEAFGKLPPEEQRAYYEAMNRAGGQAQVQAPAQLQLQQEQEQRNREQYGTMPGPGSTMPPAPVIIIEGDSNTSRVQLWNPSDGGVDPNAFPVQGRQ